MRSHQIAVFFQLTREGSIKEDASSWIHVSSWINQLHDKESHVEVEKQENTSLQQHRVSMYLLGSPVSPNP